jgi:hypothetical protein
LICRRFINAKFVPSFDPLKIGARDLTSHRLAANQIAPLFLKTNHKKFKKLNFSCKITIWKLFNPLTVVGTYAPWERNLLF